MVGVGSVGGELGGILRFRLGITATSRVVVRPALAFSYITDMTNRFLESASSASDKHA